MFFVFIMLLTGHHAGLRRHQPPAGFDEVTEVPLMAAMFAVVIVHVERRQKALEEVQRLAPPERRLPERERNLAMRRTSCGLRSPWPGHAELIRQSASGQVADDAEIVIDELGRLSRMADRLLILAAAEHPEFLRRPPVDVEHLIVETAKRWSAAPFGAGVSTRPSTGVPMAGRGAAADDARRADRERGQVHRRRRLGRDHGP